MKPGKLAITGAAAVGLAAAATLSAQLFGVSLVEDLSQEKNSASQLANDITKIARLDTQIQQAVATYNQLVMSAKFFSVKKMFAGWGNRIVANWWSPNNYGLTGNWSPMVLFGGGSPVTAWSNVTVALHMNPAIAAAGAAAMAGGRGGAYVPYSGLAANAATVETFDGAGPAAVETLGNARAQQTRMSNSVSQLQASVLDGTATTNSNVEQLNLIAAGAVQQLQMQQTTNNVLTSLLEQQTIANKIARDQLADELNYTAVWQNYAATQPSAWGSAAAAVNAFRIR